MTSIDGARMTPPARTPSEAEPFGDLDEAWLEWLAEEALSQWERDRSEQSAEDVAA